MSSLSRSEPASGATEPGEPGDAVEDLLVEATVDDMNPELYPYVLERLTEAGAVDAWVVPVIGKVGESVDRVNGQLEKVDQITDSAVDAVSSVDTAVRTLSLSIARPVQKISGLAAGVIAQV